MADRQSVSEAFEGLLANARPREALRLLLGHLRDRPWRALESPDVRMVDQLCRRVLPQLLEQHTRWLLTDQAQLEQLAGLLESALAAGYQAAETLEQLAWVRCLLGMSAAMRKDMDAAHRQMCKSQPQASAVPAPNGKLRASAARLELLEGASGGFLRTLFGVYFQCLREMGHHELANLLEAQVLRLVERIEVDESRAGVVRALFFNEQQQEGYTRLIHAAISTDADRDRTITYARAGIDLLDQSTTDAAEAATRAAEVFLRQSGYPDGLQGRSIRWEISSLQGEPVDVPRSYGGGSLGLPLAVAIVSAYLGRIVPNDTTLTGALSGTSQDGTEVLAVDGIEEKMRRAIASGCRRMFIPAGNISALTGSPALQHTVQSAGAEVRPARKVADVCGELFPVEGKGTVTALLADTIRTTAHFIVRHRPRDGQTILPATSSHRAHVLVSAALLACIFLLEGFKNYLALAADHSEGSAILRVLCATLIPTAGLLLSYGLIQASLHHRKTWAWLASIAVMAVAMSAVVPIMQPMLPAMANISIDRQWPVPLSLAKDAFIFWLFAWILLTNTFAVVGGLEHLVARRQYVTARQCLQWDSLLEGRMPVRAVHFPWNWGALAFFLIAIFLLVWEMLYYWNLRSDLTAVYWETSLGMARDMVLVVAAAEAMVFYKVALAQVRKALL